jgi:hypothetical protein
LDLLRGVANSTTEDDLAAALNRLKHSDIFKENLRVKSYLEKFWLSILQV